MSNLGKAQLLAGRLAEAESSLLTAIQVWESLRAGLGSNDINQISIFENQANTYRSLQKTLIAQNKTNAALEITERGRARAFVELLSRRLSTASMGGETPLLQALKPPNIQQIQQIAKQQNTTLVEYSVIYKDAAGQGQQEPRASELFIWVIKPTGKIAFRRVDLTSLKISLTDLVDKSRVAIGAGGRGSIIGIKPVDSISQTKGLQQLYQLLIQPIANLLPTDPNAHVIFLPQGSLFLVPFPALQDSTGKYLIEQHTILTAPAIQVLELTHQQRQLLKAGSTSFLVVGNPTMPSLAAKLGDPPQPLPPLPNAEKEALKIAQLLNTQAIIGSKATKAAIVQQMQQARIIHLATHGLLDGLKWLGTPGAIALAPAGKDDGLLTADEIFDLKLKAELIVLSACDTGRGDIKGDGVVGLSRALIAAGVPSVIVSLWSVPDAPTASLMQEFYKNLQRHSDKAQALRQAMLATKQRNPEPVNWAAFTLIGEAQ